MKTILITGGCGFIGSHFIRHVQSDVGWRIVNLDKLTYAGNLENLNDLHDSPLYRFVREDIGNPAILREIFQEEQPWAVINFAAESHVDRSILNASPFVQTNIVGVQVLLDVSREYGVKRFLQISTDEVYGDVEGKVPSPEDAHLAPSSPYSASKASADLLCLAYRRTYGIPLLIVRSCNNYGPYQFPEKLIPLMIRNAIQGERLPIYGDGLQEREWLYVDENIEAILRVLKGGQIGSIYNVGSGVTHSNLDVVHTVCRLVSEEAGVNLESIQNRIESVPDRPGHDRCYAMKLKKIKAELGWKATVSFEGGLRNTVRWYLNHQAWVDRVNTGEYRNYYDAVYRRAWR